MIPISITTSIASLVSPILYQTWLWFSCLCPLERPNRSQYVTITKRLKKPSSVFSKRWKRCRQVRALKRTSTWTTWWGRWDVGSKHTITHGCLSDAAMVKLCSWNLKRFDATKILLRLPTHPCVLFASNTARSTEQTTWISYMQGFDGFVPWSSISVASQRMVRI